MEAWRWIKDRPRWVWPILAVVVVVVIATAAVAWNGGGDQDDVATGSSSTTSEPATTSTATSTTTSAAPTTTTVPEPPAPPAPVPGAAAITAQPGGGSGEVMVRWNAVPGANGYRVLRQIGGGAFETAADFDITTGATTAADDVVNIWSEDHSYVPVRNPLPGRDGSPWFELVDYRSERQRCYQVVAYNPSGDAPTSNTACASPP